MASDKNLGKWGSFSSVYVDLFKLYRPSEIYDTNVSDDHHLYLILGIEKLFIQEHRVEENSVFLKFKNC